MARVDRAFISLALGLVGLLVVTAPKGEAPSGSGVTSPASRQWEPTVVLAGLRKGPNMAFLSKRDLNPDFLYRDRHPRFRRLDPDPELLEREHQLEQKQLVHRPDLQYWLQLAKCGSEASRRYALEKLDIAIAADNTDRDRLPDAYRPYGPQELLNEGPVHILTQVDGVRWGLAPDVFVRLAALLGVQGGGKTRETVAITSQLVRASPPPRLFIVDPKGELAPYAGLLNAVVVDLSDICLDLGAPPGMDRRRWLHGLVPQLGGVVHLIQGIGLLHETVDLACTQLERVREATGEDFELCLRDIRLALPLVSDTSGFRRSGYLEAGQTALQRVELGSGSLFVTRRGASPSKLFFGDKNVVLTARDLTDSWACQWFAVSNLWWLYQEAKDRPETNRLRLLIVVDDAQRFIARELQQGLTTPLTHILAVLRSSGTGALLVSQLPGQVDPGVLGLSNLIVVVGGVHGVQDRWTVTDLLALNRDQADYLGKLVRRESIGYYAGGRWRYPIHGTTPEVPDPRPDWDAIEAQRRAFLSGLDIKPWKNLWEFREHIDVTAGAVTTQGAAAAAAPAQAPAPQPAPGGFAPTLSGLDPEAAQLLWDVLTYPYTQFSERQARLGLSGRKGLRARGVLEQQGLVLTLAIGQSLFLIPTAQGYRAFGQEPPRVRRGISPEHSFLCQLARHLLLEQPYVSRVEAEVPVGESGATVDLVVHRKDGGLEAWEVTSSVSNVTGNAVKCGGEGFQRVVFLCRDHAVRQAVWKRIQASGLPRDLFGRIRYVLFSSLGRKGGKK